ncbi:Uma2 family endonuclease [Chamaesiphon sp. GL140_3_metabinner_50]|uniref:Uma2 family endonuclease n=1 Tax=Chamaesiphon sp. GL140_3_metabinner_50 TaxID=2970812 RepID=UPI0025DDAD90|nr:Uma2 family endonuclease [Chamaesiphon sp. GL140_3_metabinner_50]
MTTTSPKTIPLLENGDRLSRHEFERRYGAMPYQKTGSNKAELIEGIVYMASPLRVRSHAQPHVNIIGWLWTYQISNPDTIVADNPTVRLNPKNEPQPDAVMFIPGRGASITEDDYIAGAPELVVEIAASTVSIDLHDKKAAYCRNGVQEYIVWRTLDREIDWFSLQDGEYIRLEPDKNGIIKSQVFPGLWLAVESMLSGTMADVLAKLQAGLNSIDC